MHERGICIVNYPNFISAELQQYQGWEMYSQLKTKAVLNSSERLQKRPLVCVKLEGKTAISILSLEIRENCLNLNYPENIHVF